MHGGVNTVVPNYDLVWRDAIGQQLILLHLGRGDDSRGIPPELCAQDAVPDLFQSKSAIDRTIHSHRLDYVGNSLDACKMN